MWLVHGLSTYRNPADVSLGKRDAGFEFQTSPFARDLIQRNSHGLPFLRMDLVRKRVKSDCAFRRDTEQSATLPRCPDFSGRRIPAPNSQFDRFSRQTHALLALVQRRFRPPPARELQQQAADQERLQDEDEYGSEYIAVILGPYRWRAKAHNGVRGQLALADPPTLQLAPVEHGFAGAYSYPSEIGRRLAREELQRQPGRRLG